MAYVKGKIFDRNRYSKKYPLVRAPKKMTFRGDADLQIEAFTVSFNNESEKVAFFDAPYDDTNFRILLSARETTGSDSAQVSLAVDHSGTTSEQVRIEASAPFTGDVDVVVLRVSST